MIIVMPASTNADVTSPIADVGTVEISEIAVEVAVALEIGVVVVLEIVVVDVGWLVEVLVSTKDGKCALITSRLVSAGRT